MRSISSTIVEELRNMNAIKNEEMDICKYGLEIFLSSIVEIVNILIISICVGNFIETVFLFLTFIPLRIYAGGYHADTKLRCYLVSIMMYVLFTIIIWILPEELYFLMVVISSVISSIIVIAMAPIVHYNKTLSSIEKNRYKKYSIIISLIETVISITWTVVLPAQCIGVSLALGQTAVTIAMIVAIIKEKY